MTIELPRRRFLQGLAALIAAPAVVKVTSLMPIKPFYAPMSVDGMMTVHVDWTAHVGANAFRTMQEALDYVSRWQDGTPGTDYAAIQVAEGVYGPFSAEASHNRVLTIKGAGTDKTFFDARETDLPMFTAILGGVMELNNFTARCQHPIFEATTYAQILAPTISVERDRRIEQPELRERGEYS
jgi:hypothetical protein